MKLHDLFVAMASIIFLSGCVTVTPLVNSVDLTKVDFSDVKRFKTGDSCAYYVLGFIGPFGTSSIPDAVEDANIKSVKSVSSQVSNYVLFGKSCVRVFGS